MIYLSPTVHIICSKYYICTICDHVFVDFKGEVNQNKPKSIIILTKQSVIRDVRKMYLPNVHRFIFYVKPECIQNVFFEREKKIVNVFCLNCINWKQRQHKSKIKGLI